MDPYQIYIPSNPSDSEWGLFATGCGFAQTDPRISYPPTKHPLGYHFDYDSGRTLNEYQIIYITEGSGIFRNRHQKHEVKSGDIIILFPDEWHSYKPHEETGWHEHWVSFSGKSADSFMSKTFFPRNSPIISIGLRPDIIDIYNSIHNSIEEIKSGLQYIIASFIMQIASSVYCYNKSSDKGSNKEGEMINTAKFEIQNSPGLKVNFENLSKRLNVSYSKFRKTFKEHSGQSPYKYLQEVRINRIKNMLKNTSKPIQEIADICGFDNAYHLSNAFKLKVGLSPKAWRAQNRKS